VLNDKTKRFEKSIFSYGIFHHANGQIAKRFKRLTDLTFDRKMALPAKKLSNNGLLTFRGERANNQLVFINNSGNLVGRIFLPVGATTSRKKKHEVIDLMLN
jgi:hypothetical protein